MIYLGHVTLTCNAINTVITLVIQLITASQAVVGFYLLQKHWIYGISL